jgi:hypothetical protein
MNILPGAGGSDRGPDGTPLQFSNPADEEPDLCVWCGGNAEDGATVPVVTREEAESVHPSMKVIPDRWYGNGHGWGIRLCETCNEERKANWEDEDFNLGLERICEYLGISAELAPMERSAAAIEKIKELATVVVKWPAGFATDPVNLPTGRLLVSPQGLAELRAFARISGYPEGRFSFEVPFKKDLEAWGTDIAERLGITREEEQAYLDSLPKVSDRKEDADG